LLNFGEGYHYALFLRLDFIIIRLVLPVYSLIGWNFDATGKEFYSVPGDLHQN
jgi:hypothetical protein